MYRVRVAIALLASAWFGTFSGNGHLSYLEDEIPGMVDHLCSDFDVFLPQSAQHPVLHFSGKEQPRMKLP